MESPSVSSIGPRVTSRTNRSHCERVRDQSVTALARKAGFSFVPGELRREDVDGRATLLSSAARGGRASMTGRPNILLVMVDQLAAAHRPAYGNPVVQAPRLSELADAGTVFESAYTASPLCSPSRFSMLTGRLPSSLAGYDNAAELPVGTPAVAHVPSVGLRLDAGLDARTERASRVVPPSVTSAGTWRRSSAACSRASASGGSSPARSPRAPTRRRTSSPSPTPRWRTCGATPRAEVTVSDGERREFGAGDVLLLEDTEGRGHRTRTTSEGVRRTPFIPLAPDRRGRG